MLTPLKVRRVTVKEQAACCQRAVGLGRRLRTYNIAPAAALKCCNSALSLLLLFAADSLINVLSSRRRTASSVQTSSVQRSRTANTVYSAIDCCTTNEIVAGTAAACLSQHCQTSPAAKSIFVHSVLLSFDGRKTDICICSWVTQFSRVKLQ